MATAISKHRHIWWQRGISCASLAYARHTVTRIIYHKQHRAAHGGATIMKAFSRAHALRCSASLSRGTLSRGISAARASAAMKRSWHGIGAQQTSYKRRAGSSIKIFRCRAPLAALCYQAWREVASAWRK